jgi:hypothetical protein
VISFPLDKYLVVGSLDLFFFHLMYLGDCFTSYYSFDSYSIFNFMNVKQLNGVLLINVSDILQFQKKIDVVVNTHLLPFCMCECIL